MSEVQRGETARGERKLTFVIDDDALFNGDRGESEGEASGSFLELAIALAQRKWFILKVTAAATVVGVVVAVLLPNWYTAETKILPPQQQSQSTAAALLSSLSGTVGSIASAAGKDLGIKNPNDLYVGMLKSRPVADAIINRFDLQKLYRSKDMTYARKDLAEHTTITSEKEGFISVAVEDKDKKRAEEMANAYIEELRKLTKGLAVTEASQRRLFFEDQLRQAKDDLANAEVALALAQQKSGIVALDAQAKAMIDTVSKLRAEIAAQQVKLQALRTFATDKNADVEVAQSQLEQMQTELKNLEKKGDTSSYEVSLKDVPEAGVQYVRAEREVKYRTSLFEVLARQYEAAKLDEAKDAAIIQVVEPAVIPDHKSSPKRLAIVIVMGVAGLLIACFMIWFSLKWKIRMHYDLRHAEQVRAFREAISSK